MRYKIFYTFFLNNHSVIIVSIKGTINNQKSYFTFALCDRFLLFLDQTFISKSYKRNLMKADFTVYTQEYFASFCTICFSESVWGCVQNVCGR